MELLGLQQRHCRIERLWFLRLRSRRNHSLLFGEQLHLRGKLSPSCGVGLALIMFSFAVGIVLCINPSFKPVLHGIVLVAPGHEDCLCVVWNTGTPRLTFQAALTPTDGLSDHGGRLRDVLLEALLGHALGGLE